MIAADETMRESPSTLRGSAFTLVEMLVTIAILALVAATVAPMFSDERGLRVVAAARILSSDIELAQVLTISRPAEPVVVRFDAATSTYWLAYAYDTETPLPRPDNGEPYLVEFGVGRARSAMDVLMALDGVTSDMIEFESSGALVDFATTPMIELSSGPSAVTLSISPMTGSILEQQGTIGSLKGDDDEK
jgi:prepilin-type N-terminal cleavage/methylation domain-containing protein